MEVVWCSLGFSPVVMAEMVAAVVLGSLEEQRWKLWSRWCVTAKGDEGFWSPVMGLSLGRKWMVVSVGRNGIHRQRVAV